MTVQMSNTFIADITVDVNQQVNTIKDSSAWLYINIEFGFGIKVRFYKKHLDLFLTKTTGLTNKVHGLIGMNIHVCVYVCMCMHTCVCVHACTCACMHVHVRACVHVCVCMCVCMRVCGHNILYLSMYT